MQTVPLELSDVIYNAATQSFEARVTVHDRTGARSYACAIDAPITMEFADAADLCRTPKHPYTQKLLSAAEC